MSHHIANERKVLDHLRESPLTSWLAFKQYHITRLAAYIHRLRLKGFDIESNVLHDPERPSRHWVAYTLKTEMP